MSLDLRDADWPAQLHIWLGLGHVPVTPYHALHNRGQPDSIDSIELSDSKRRQVQNHRKRFHGHLQPTFTTSYHLAPTLFQADNSVSTVAFKFQAHHHFSRPINPQAVQGVEAARRPREPEYGGGHAGPNTAAATRARIRRGPRGPEYGGGHAGPNAAGATRDRIRRRPRGPEYGGGHASPNTAAATRARIRRRR